MTNTATKVGFLAARFSHLLRLSYDTSAANILDMQYQLRNGFPKVISDFLALKRAHSSTKVNVGHYFLNC